MNFPKEIRFEILNGLSEKDVINADYVVYAHQALSGLYIGKTDDPVRRLREHFESAFNDKDIRAKEPFKQAIRQERNAIKHYILAVGKSEAVISKKEAAAINFYKPNLNIRLVENTFEHNDRDYGYRRLENQRGKVIILKSKNRNSRQQNVYSDSDRKTVIAEVYVNSGKKKIRTIKGQIYPEGLNISCSRAERERFNPGDLVKIKVAPPSIDKGKTYLQAPQSSKLILYKALGSK